MHDFQQGVTFKFCDAQGHYIYGVGYGKVADNKCIMNDMQVVLFFCKIQPEFNGDVPKLWLYSDAIILSKPSSSSFPPAKNAIVVRTEDKKGSR